MNRPAVRVGPGMTDTSRSSGTGPTLGAAISFSPDAENAVDAAIARARAAADAGIGGIWLGQRFDYDAISLLALIGREVPDVSVGVSAVPIYGRHPLTVAAQTLTAQAATHGRFQLGLALGAARLTEQAFDVPFTRSAARLEEFVSIVRQVLTTGSVEFHGDAFDTTLPFPATLPGADPVPPILVAALGPRALAVSGRVADGILPNLAAPSVLERDIIPTLSAAAEQAGRPTPRVIALVPALVTDSGDARERLAQATALYNTIPSYPRVLDLGGFSRAADLALVGSADEVAAGLREYLDAGATDVIVTQTELLRPDVQHETWEAAASALG
ncbi:TIGR03564 family F420-dependent LLM class oxidoreductase [Gordonia sp. ABSL49_1]|nr:TIGR03564 family F420-dependent LLM class oxidoreductase [Gordonia sp. ABSL49_1]MCH5645633.1 TIGR03564 family F420-dependent LLM class oxidoreductase [Gordonia sp. ABSL49_1]